MKGFRFYEVFPSAADKRRRNGNQQVLALVLGDDGRPLFNGATFDCIASVYDAPNSPVASTGVSLKFLRSRCRRIPERRARAIHERLFSDMAGPTAWVEKGHC